MIKVLICDDAAFMRYTLRDILEKNGFEVVGEAVDAEDAVIKYQELNPDLVTMDITMPKGDGIKALREILSIDSSAMGQQAMVLESIQSGAKDFIIKPFEPKRVVESINKLTNNKGVVNVN